MTAPGKSCQSGFDCRKASLECLLRPGDLNRSMQHLISNYREEDVENEAATEDLLLIRSESVDVGPLVERRFYACHSGPFLSGLFISSGHSVRDRRDTATSGSRQIQKTRHLGGSLLTVGPRKSNDSGVRIRSGTSRHACVRVTRPSQTANAREQAAASDYV